MKVTDSGEYSYQTAEEGSQLFRDRAHQASVASVVAFIRPVFTSGPVVRAPVGVRSAFLL